MTAIALIPARGGSKRIPGKNIRELAGRPLLAYAIESAFESGRFSRVLVSSDDSKTLEIAASLGADCVRRPPGFASDVSPDIDWVKHALRAANYVVYSASSAESGSSDDDESSIDTFSILRPTSPFRTAKTIRRAFDDWWRANGLTEATSERAEATFESAAIGTTNPPTDTGLRSTRKRYSSLRAVEPVSQHPGKMWQIRDSELVPLMLQPSAQPFHDTQLAALPRVYVQNASLEIAWISTVGETETISGDRIFPFETQGHEGFDLNTEYDWAVAEQMIAAGAELADAS